MSIWTDPITIPPLMFIGSILSYLVNKYIEKKYGLKLPQGDYEKIDYATDKLVDNFVKQEKKFGWLLGRNRDKNNDTVEEIIDNVKTIPAIIKIEDRLGNLENDFGVMLPLFNKELEYFKEEIEKILPPNCTEEQKARCIEHFLEIKKLLNDDQD
jgi:hypothetical protein